VHTTHSPTRALNNYFCTISLLFDVVPVGNEGHWTWPHNGEDLTDAFWGANRPNNKSGNIDDCGVMVLQRDNFWWEDRSCLATTVQKKIVAPICQHDSAAATAGTTTPDITTTTEISCPTGWEKFEGRCYLFPGTTYGSWDSAETICVGKGGHLASVHSYAEMDFIWNLSLSSTGPIWLGGSDYSSEVKSRIFTEVDQPAVYF